MLPIRQDARCQASLPGNDPFSLTPYAFTSSYYLKQIEDAMVRSIKGDQKNLLMPKKSPSTQFSKKKDVVIAYSDSP